MDTELAKKVAVAAAAAAVANTSAPYLAGSDVDVVAVIVAVLSTVIAYLTKSPRE